MRTVKYFLPQAKRSSVFYQFNAQKSTRLYNSFMVKFITDILGLEIVLFQEKARLGKVSDLIFSADNGSVLGLICFDPIRKKKRVLVTSEIKKVSGGIILVNGYDSIEDVGDVIRLNKAMQDNVKIIGAKVITVSGQYVGRVNDATIDLTHFRLSRLYVDPPLGINFFAQATLIPAKKIVRIEKKKIIISDNFVIVPGLKIAAINKTS